MRSVDHELCQRPAKAIMDLFRQLGPARRAEQVELALIIPLPHDREPIEQRNIVLLRHHPHIVEVWRHRDHGFGTRTVLQVHQDDVSPCLLQRNNPSGHCAAKIIGIDGSDSIDSPGLPDNQSRRFCFHQLNEAGGRLLGRFLALYFYEDVHSLGLRQVLLQDSLLPRPVRAVPASRNRGRAAPDDQDFERLAGLDGIGDLGKLAFAGEQIGRQFAGCGGGWSSRGRRSSRRGRRSRRSIVRTRRRRGETTAQQDQAQENLRLHQPPPAISALPTALLVFEPLLSATRLYHEISQAMAHMIRIPERLISACMTGPPETSARMKWPAKARKTPRQNISRECEPHRISGRSHGDFKPGQSRGRTRTVSAASAKKCVKRSTSRSALSIGYIHCSSRFGMKWESCGTYQVSVT